MKQLSKSPAKKKFSLLVGGQDIMVEQPKQKIKKVGSMKEFLSLFSQASKENLIKVTSDGYI
jgi:hypothetical protein